MRLLYLLLLTACVSEQQIRGELYINDGIPTHLCTAFPLIKQYGIYRVVKCPNKTIVGCKNGEKEYEEVIPYCSNRIKKFNSADMIQVNEWIKQATRPR
jgi:hypothetical protein